VRREVVLTLAADCRRRWTTNSRHSFPRYPNLGERPEVIPPDHVWVTGITYNRLLEEFVYSAVVVVSSHSGMHDLTSRSEAPD
jgi:hypothetical protein